MSGGPTLQGESKPFLAPAGVCVVVNPSRLATTRSECRDLSCCFRPDETAQHNIKLLLLTDALGNLNLASLLRALHHASASPT